MVAIRCNRQLPTFLNLSTIDKVWNKTAPCGSSDLAKGIDKSSYKRRNVETFACGYCDENCLYNAIEIGFLIGVVANILVIAAVCKDKRLREPTFIGIAALAVADLLFLTLNLTVSFETVILSITCISQKSIIVKRPWYILNSMIWFSANAHVALLAVLRYLTIIYPIKSTLYLTPKRVMLLSAGVWALGMILLGTLAGLITLKLVMPGKSQEFIIIWWITVYLLPLIVTSILHLLKLFRVKKATKCSASQSTKKSINRMSKVVPLVIVMATVLPLPKLIFNCIRTAGMDHFPSETFHKHFGGVANLVYLINHFINPFIYAFLSKKFRRSLKDMFSCRKCRRLSVETHISSSSSQPKIATICGNKDLPGRNLSSVSSVDTVVTSVSSGSNGSRSYSRICSLDSETSNSRNLSSVSSCDSEDTARAFT